jgi:hypothetical protein
MTGGAPQSGREERTRRLGRAGISIRQSCAPLRLCLGSTGVQPADRSARSDNRRHSRMTTQNSSCTAPSEEPNIKKEDHVGPLPIDRKGGRQDCLRATTVNGSRTMNMGSTSQDTVHSLGYPLLVTDASYMPAGIIAFNHHLICSAQPLTMMPAVSGGGTSIFPQQQDTPHQKRSSRRTTSQMGRSQHLATPTLMMHCL